VFWFVFFSLKKLIFKKELAMDCGTNPLEQVFDELKTKKNDKFTEVYQKIQKGDDNPLSAKIGDSMFFKHEKGISQVELFLTSISSYQEFDSINHVDYALNGNCPILQEEISLRLRVQASTRVEKSVDFFLFQILEKKEWDQDYEKKLKQQEYVVEFDNCGTKLLNPRKYWRIDDNFEPSIFIVKQKIKHNDSNLCVNCESSSTQWDFHRLTNDYKGLKFIEFLIFDLNNKNKNLSILRGIKINFNKLPKSIRDRFMS
jgi:hypothetical protein